MKFEILLKELKSLNLAEDSFAVIHSGALAVRGIREANDLDIIVTKEFWKKFAAEKPIRKTKLGYKIKLSKNVEIMGGRIDKQKEDWKFIDKQIIRADIIGGIKYVKLSEVKKFKRILGRKEDFLDIKLIDKYLNRKNG